MIRRRSPLWFVGSAFGAMWLASLALLAPPVAASAGSDSTINAVYPPAPCTSDTVRVLVQGFLPTPCDSFIGAFKVNDRTVRRLTQTYFTRQCFAAPFQFFSVPVVMGRFPAGTQEIEMENWVIIRDESGAPVDTTKSSFTLRFEVAETCPLPSVPAGKLPFVVSVTAVPNPPCPNQPTTLRLQGVFMNDCSSVVSVDSLGLSLMIAPYPPVTSPCAPVLVPWSVDLPLGLLAAGHHAVRVRMTVLGSDDAHPPLPTLTYDGVFTFDVPRDCNQTERLPYVDFIQLSGKPASTGGICEGDSILVTLGGTFPSSCFEVDSLISFEGPWMGPMPMPQIVRLVVSDQGCSRIACPAVLQPWTRSITIPGLPRGSYGLFVEEYRTLGCPPIEDRHVTGVPFHVAPAESCVVQPYRCIRPGWGPYANEMCSAFVAPGDTANVILDIRSPVALAGLEGRLYVHGDAAGARIVGLEPVGAAAGMQLSWSPTQDGAHFVMYALDGTRIPGHSPLDQATSPVLLVKVKLEPQSQASRIEVSTRWSLLGSDGDGQGVPECAVRGQKPATAVICVGRGECDRNEDGRLDVRDLVLMVRCIQSDIGCLADMTDLDCDGDGETNVNDVLCCASELLRGPGCPACPVDTVRAAPEVSVRFGAARRTASGMDVPVQIHGSFSIGAARLVIRFPSDRFVVGAVAGRPGWLQLHQTRGNELTLGIINGFGPVPANVYTGEPLELTLRLTSRGGVEPGGRLVVTEGDFSGIDGVKLRVDLGEPQLTLGAEGAVSLSAAQPNPFDGSTRFSVQMERPGLLDVGIYDLAGRRIATLFHGPAEAGARAFTWDGRTDDGTPTAGGVYFYRAVTAGHSVTRKMVMLRGR